jgi:hypothetical protein
MNHPWLEAKRETLGRRAQPRTCHHCGRPTLVGLDADMAALTVTVDLEPASRILETIHLLAGGHSYELVGPDLHYRDPSYIKRRDYPVHLSHQCREANNDT